MRDEVEACGAGTAAGYSPKLLGQGLRRRGRADVAAVAGAVVPVLLVSRPALWGPARSRKSR